MAESHGRTDAELVNIMFGGGWALPGLIQITGLPGGPRSWATNRQLLDRSRCGTSARGCRAQVVLIRQLERCVVLVEPMRHHFQPAPRSPKSFKCPKSTYPTQQGDFAAIDPGIQPPRWLVVVLPGSIDDHKAGRQPLQIEPYNPPRLLELGVCPPA